MRKRILSLALACTLLLGLLAGCGGGTSTASPQPEGGDASVKYSTGDAVGDVNFDEEPYEVNFMYFVGAEGSNMDSVRAAVNELALREINMTVNLIPMTQGTYMQQLPMMLAANEPLDLFPGLSANFATFIEAQYIVNMADYLEYAPDIIETLGEDAWAGYMGDFLVGFAMMKERSYPSGLIVRKDIFDELGYRVEDFDISLEDLDSYNQLTELFAAVHEAYPTMTVFDGNTNLATQLSSFTDRMGDYFGVLPNYARETTVENWFETEEYRRFCELAREWYLAGYSSTDMAVNPEAGELKMRAGNTFSYMTTTKPNTAVEKYTLTGYEVEVIPLGESLKTTNAVNSILYCTANASQDPAKAMQFLNWAYTSGEFNDLLNWGVEGEDWVETPDGFAAYPEGVDISSVGYHQDGGWAYPNQYIAHVWEGNDIDIWEQYHAYYGASAKSVAYGFNFDSSPVANELAQLNSVLEQYQNDLAFGAIDPDTGIAAFNDALYAAGLQTVMEEKQRQLDEWLAAR